VHRGEQGERQATRTPGNKPARKSSVKPAAAKTPSTLQTEGGLTKRRGGGGGGGGIEKPQRVDPVRRRLITWVPGQMEAVKEANVIFYSPRQRMEACRFQRNEHQYHPKCPLSPVESRPCSTPECNCNLSHGQLTRVLALGSPSQSINQHYELGPVGRETRERQKQGLEQAKAADAAATALAADLAARQAAAAVLAPPPPHPSPTPATSPGGGGGGSLDSPMAVVVDVLLRAGSLLEGATRLFS